MPREPVYHLEVPGGDGYNTLCGRESAALQREPLGFQDCAACQRTYDNLSPDERKLFERRFE